MSFLFNRKRIKAKENTEQDKKADESPTSSRVLLAGISESGKTTLLKRLLLLKELVCLAKPTDETTWLYAKYSILQNTFDGLQVLNCSLLFPENDVEYEDALELIFALWRTNRDPWCSLPVNTEPDQITSDLDWFDDDAIDALNYVWSLSNFQESIRLREEQRHMYLSKNYAYYMTKLLENYPTWGSRGYKFSVEDYLWIYDSTGETVESKIRHKDHDFHVLDTSGEELRWNQVFHQMDGASTLVFCVAAGDYDQIETNNAIPVIHDGRVLYPGTRKIKECLDLFTYFTSDEYQEHVQLVLVFTQIELFKEKFSIRKIPLDTFGLFPNAPTDTNDVPGALEFIAQQFLERRENKSRDVSIHYVDSIYSEDSVLVRLLDDFA